MSRDLYLDGTTFPVFPLGVYMISLTVIESFTDGSSEKVGVIKYYIEVMEMIKNKKKSP